MRAALWGLAALAALALAAFVAFNAYFYPALGLSHFTREDYQPAWQAVAQGFCATSGLSYQGAEQVKFRTVSQGSEAYVWGVARAKTAQGGDRLAWIYLEWSGKRHVWLRNYCLVLADDDDEIYYAPDFPSQFRRASLALGKALGENARHAREAAQYFGYPGAFISQGPGAGR